MTFLNPTDSLRNLTSAMGKKEKFSYINVPKSSIVALSKNSENPFPANFAKNIISSLKNNDKRIMKAISHTLVSDIENGRIQIDIGDGSCCISLSSNIHTQILVLQLYI